MQALPSPLFLSETPEVLWGCLLDWVEHSSLRARFALCNPQTQPSDHFHASSSTLEGFGPAMLGSPRALWLWARFVTP